MRYRFGPIALATLLIVAAPAARAADPLAVAVSPQDSLPVADAGFDWNGFYAGVFGAAQTSGVGGGQLGLGLDIGANARLEFILVGAEVAVQGLSGGTGPTAYVQGLGKLGLAVTDDVIVYGAAGAGTSLTGPAESDVLLGGGVAFAVGNDMTVDARYLHGFELSGANPKDRITVGANFHF